MKAFLKTFITILFVILIISCKKSNDSAPSATESYYDFLINTQWVGTLHGNTFQYPPPCCIRINSDTTIAVYGPFQFITNNDWQYTDSIKGKISSIDSLPDGRTLVKIKFNFIDDVEIYISDRKTLSSTTVGLNKYNPFQAELFNNNLDIKGTTWSGHVITESGPTNGMNAYPDLSSVTFMADKSVTRYHRGGQLISNTDLTPLESLYSQKGAMILMYGFNETNNELPTYFGVLLPSGDKMMVFSRENSSRLPYYSQTPAWYGPIGVTPIINRRYLKDIYLVSEK